MKEQKIFVRIEEKLAEKMRLKCVKEKLSLKQFIEEAVRLRLKNEKM